MSNHPIKIALLLAALLMSLGACDEAPPDRAASAGEVPLDRAEYPVMTVCGGDETVQGIDVSHWQQEIAWDTVAASGEAQFAYIRIGDGMGTDSQFDRNWPEAARVGIPRGAYHFFRPGRDALDQATHFMSMVDGAGGYQANDLPPMIDIEATDGEPVATVIAQAQIWMDHVEAATGKRPIIYTGSYFWDDNVGRSTEFSDHHLWTAHYTSAPCPLITDGWTSWAVWQFTSTGSVPGISGDVDVNRFNGSLDDLALWPACSAYWPMSECVAPDWWCPAIDGLRDLGLFDATCDSFKRNDRSSRAEWAVLIGDALQLDQTEAFTLCRLPFSDVAEDDVAARHIAALAALERGDGETVFATGESITSFNPDAPATRCEATKMVVESWGLPTVGSTPLNFSDSDAIPSWCAPYVQRAVSAGVIAHTATAFRPDDDATVGEMAQMVLNAINAHGRPLPAPEDFNDPTCQPPITCTDQCPVDALQCEGRDVVTCGVSANGCAAWGQPEQCPAREACGGEGLCVDVCVDECEIGARECSTTGPRACIQDLEGCYVWGPEQACSANEQCVDGVCDAPSECTGADCDASTAPDGGGQEVMDADPTSPPDDCGCSTLRASSEGLPSRPISALFLIALFFWRQRRRTPRPSTTNKS